MTDFINSRLGSLVESNRKKNKEYTDRISKQNETLSRTAEAHNQRYNQASSRSAQRYGTPVDIARLQRDLYYGGYYDKDVTYDQAVDGIWGKKTQDALNRSKLGSKKETDSKKETNSKVNPINLEKARELYNNGTGVGDAAALFAFHDVAPQKWKMPHSKGLKQQLAAAVAFDKSKEGYHDKRANGDSMIDYRTYGKLSNQDSNVNKQATKNNGAAMSMGGLTYKQRNDSIIFPDVYAFNVIRDNRTGKVIQNDPYKGKPFQGLIADILSGNLSARNIAENYGTRRGKQRDNTVAMSIDDINKMNNRLDLAKQIRDNYWSNYSEFK